MDTNPSEHPDARYEAPAVDRRTGVDATLIGLTVSDPVCMSIRSDEG